MHFQHVFSRCRWSRDHTLRITVVNPEGPAERETASALGRLRDTSREMVAFGVGWEVAKISSSLTVTEGKSGG